jgi:hypothetical protein
MFTGMRQDVEGGHEEISSRHPLVALPFGPILTFLGVRPRRGPRMTGRSGAMVAEQAPAVADRRGRVPGGQHDRHRGRAWFVLETTGSPARMGIVSAALAIGGVTPTLLGGPLVDRILAESRRSIQPYFVAPTVRTLTAPRRRCR